jgi:hypothetical protein
LCAIASFLLAIVLDQLTMLLLSGFFLFLLAGFGLACRLIISSFCDYFSTSQRMERKLLFYTGKRNHLNRIFRFKKARLLYFNQQQRKQLLKQSDQKSAAS